MKLKTLALAMVASGFALSVGVASAAGVTVKKVTTPAAPLVTASTATPSALSDLATDANIHDPILTPRQKLILLIWWRRNNPNPSES